MYYYFSFKNKAFIYMVSQKKCLLREANHLPKAHDQKQLYRLNETKSHSGAFEICQAVSFALFLAFLAP